MKPFLVDDNRHLFTAGYDEENPKILTKCDHHFHLSCMLEWMERSDICPLCDQVRTAVHVVNIQNLLPFHLKSFVTSKLLNVCFFLDAGDDYQPFCRIVVTVNTALCLLHCE